MEQRTSQRKLWQQQKLNNFQFEEFSKERDTE
jgi:hypothetical protein